MRQHDYLAGLARLAKVADAEERRGVWRQSMATLAAAVADQAPVPLEGLDPDDLQASIRTAIAANLTDDLGFLSPPAAAAALYELAAAVRVGPERRELGRRVIKWLHEGDARTFVALATQIALGARRALSGAPVRARVALALDLPLGTGARADALALALVSRRDVEREWLTVPSTGSLPSRRLAARLIERAAREAARRAAQGDDGGLRVFETESVRAAWARLLSDRESLVWRHVATARGLLSERVPELGQAIASELDPKLTPTEWRRAAASLAARIAVRPDESVARARELLDSPILSADRGVASAMILGLPRALEAEPEAAEELLTALVRKGGIDAVEALVELKRERVGGEVGAWASELARAQLRELRDAGGAEDDGRAALIEVLHAELDPDEAGRGGTLHERIGAALVAFATHGPREAYSAAYEILDAADGTVGMLELSSESDRDSRRNAFRALRELDLALLEKSTLAELLLLGAKADGTTPATALYDRLFGRLSGWLRGREAEPIARGGAVPHLVHRIRRLRTFLHLTDADETVGDGDTTGLRERRLAASQLLLTRVASDAATPLRRITCAAAARACDALVRDETCEVSDAILAITAAARDAHDLETFAEATMVPDIEAPLRAYAALEKTVTSASGGGASERAAIDALLALAHSMPVALSPRVEALRAVIGGLARALESIASANSLTELAEGTDGTLLARLEAAVHAFAQLVSGARRRLGAGAEADPAAGPAVRLLDFCVERALRGSRETLRDALDGARETLQKELPEHVANAVLVVLERLATLPDDAPRRTRVSFIPSIPAVAPLPAWLPPNRVLGGFYVVRPLGAGAGGSVFVARRADQRAEGGAERFALKVPEYDGAAARTLSEAEFLTLFRQEAGALLSVPAQTNLARFVTFDAGARPKPILVMELVEGPTLERFLQMRALTTRRAFDVLDGIAAGIAAMHEVGVAHLDVKPSNVILRDPDGVAGPMEPSEPVLVDFGLAGRHVRPGCGTGEYGAPEVWGAFGSSFNGDPRPADVYAFACLAFEVLTGHTLFTAPTEIALITSHLSHDGRPQGLDLLDGVPTGEELAAILSSGLKRKPDDRVSITGLRAAVASLRSDHQGVPWPIAGG